MSLTTEWTAPAGTAALIFDVDGTLADTMPVHYTAWRAMLADHALDFPEDRFYALGGMPSSAIIRLLADEQGVPVADADIPAMVAEKERRYLSLTDTIEPIGPVVAVAASYRGRLPMAVASGGQGHVVRRTLSVIGAIDWFDAIVGSEDTERHKPEPDVFLEAARRLGVGAEACVVFEDGDLGIEAADRAGMAVIDVRLAPWR